MNREEAIKVLNSRPYTGEVREALETLIPELRESEDEIARKGLINFLNQPLIADKITFETKILWLAYLEKQKEQSKEGLGKYSEEENLAHRLNWVMQDYYKAGEDDEEKEHRFKCYKLFWDALEDSEFFNRLESHKEELTKLQERCKKFVENQKEQRLEDTTDEFTQNIRNLITNKLTVHTKGLDGSEVSSTVSIDDKTANDIASGILFYIGKEAMKNPNREIPEWSEKDEKNLELIIDCIYTFYPDPVMKYKLKDWLRSLRPSWKPSEEQMEALERASTNKYLSAKQFDILVSLYEQLKKQ